MEKITIELEAEFVEQIFNVACEASQNAERLLNLLDDESDNYSDRGLEVMQEMYRKDIDACKKISDFFGDLF